MSSARTKVFDLLLSCARVAARVRHRVRPPRRRITVVTVNWNSEPYLANLIKAVRRHSPSDVKILVVDNASTDGSRALLRSTAGVRRILLPRNLGHGRALDIGVTLAGSRYAVALDVDAFPISDEWLRTVIDPLEAGFTVVGARSGRGFAHPCFMAMRTDRFLAKRHSFRPLYEGGELVADVGEAVSMRDGGSVKLIEPTSVRGPGCVGTVFGDVVYHNFYSTRFSGSGPDQLDGEVTRSDPERAWGEALARYGLE